NLRPEPNRSDLRIRGETILIVDDFCTSGRSAEAARLYVEAAGGRARIYTWLKTISTPYEQAVDAPKLRPYIANQVGEPNRTISHGYRSGIIAPAAPA